MEGRRGREREEGGVGRRWRKEGKGKGEGSRGRK